MRKTIVMFIVALMLLSGCGSENEENQTNNGEPTIIGEWEQVVSSRGGETFNFKTDGTYTWSRYDSVSEDRYSFDGKTLMLKNRQEQVSFKSNDTMEWGGSNTYVRTKWQTSPIAQEILGIWENTNNGTILEFLADGTYEEIRANGDVAPGFYYITNDGQVLTLAGRGGLISFNFTIEYDSLDLTGFANFERIAEGEARQLPIDNQIEEEFDQGAPLEQFPFTVIIYRMNGQTEAGEFHFGEKEYSTPIITIIGENLDTAETNRGDSASFMLPAGDYTVQVEAPPYIPANQDFSLTESQQQIDVRLTMEPLDVTQHILLGQQVINHQTGEVVLNWPANVIGVWANDPTRFLTGVVGQNYLQYFIDGSRDEPLVFEDESVPRYPYLLTDLQQVVFEKNNDLWIADVDWENSQLNNDRQLTQVGLFNGDDFYYQHGNYLLTNAGGEKVRVDLQTGDVIEAPVGWYQLDERMSPDNGLILGRDDDDEIYAYDVTTGKQIILLEGGVRTQTYDWINNQQALISFTWPSDKRGVWLFDRKSSQLTHIFNRELDEDYDARMFKFYSPNQQFAFAMDDGVGSLFNIETAELIPISPGIQHIEWLSETELLFSREKDDDVAISDVGTWLFDVITQESSKIIPYPYTSILSLPEQPYVVMIANDNLWRLEIETMETVQLTDSGEFDHGQLRKLELLNP